MNELHQISRLAVVDDEQATGLVSAETRAALAGQIAATSAGEPGARRHDGHGRTTARRRWVAGVPAAVALGGALLVISVLGRPGDAIGPVGVGSAKAALVVTRHGHSVDVVVRDPKAVVADVQRFRAELKADAVNVAIVLVPVPHPLAGKFLGFGAGGVLGDAAGLTPIGKVGLRVSSGYQGEAQIFFGRAAKRGEDYVVTLPVTAPGEPLWGQPIVGQRVSAALPPVNRAGLSVEAYNVEKRTSDGTVVDHTVASVPGSYFVYAADATEPGQVLLVVGPARARPIGHHGAPGPEPGGTPAPLYG